MVPLVKFRLFDTDLDTSITNVEEQVTRVNTHLQKWKKFLSESKHYSHSIRISHTDQDMLTIAFPITFLKPTPLEKNALQEELFDIMEILQKSDLL
jgi:DNA repair ATPase RecN